MRNRTLVMMALAITLAVVTAACAETTSEPGGIPSEYQTIDEFMGYTDFAADAEYQAYTDLRHRIEEKLVECMADRGLEYVAREGDPGSRPMLGEGLSESEFTLQYGYGIFSAMLDEARWNTEYPPDEQGADPDTLWGEFTDDLDSYMLVLEECTVQVEEEVGRPDPGTTEALVAALEQAWSPLESELEETQRRIERDSRHVEAEEAWSDCMANHGYDFAADEDIDHYMMTKLGEFEEEANLGTLVLTESFERDIQPLVDEELAIAAADLGCRGELDRIREALQREYEGLFIDEHRERLEEIRELEQQLSEVLLEGWQW